MANPLLRDDVFRSQGTTEVMTVSGAINKSIILWLLLAVSAVLSWMNSHVTGHLIWPLLIAGFVLAMIIIFKKTSAPFLSPLYAIVEGLFLGAFSFIFEKMYPGIVMNAIFLTIAVLFCMLAAYKTGLLKATPRFKKVVILATSAILFVYIIHILMMVFTGSGMYFLTINDSSWLGIGVSLFVVTIAAFNLVIDFDLIENGARQGAPKYMEWFGAFALMVTLIWLYVEMLRLLARLRN
ncbi:MAG: Bax inhibitor-1/YccA family protein [Endomicrobia bacterium]|nr:Bax inhibitor-1/YccA family protein [Endomicrobiia bacterium]